ncbi:hypothetical protein L204_102879 [Cryptococcus depauperatus]
MRSTAKSRCLNHGYTSEMPMQQEPNIPALSIRNTLAVYPVMGPSSAHILHSYGDWNRLEQDLTTKLVCRYISHSAQRRAYGSGSHPVGVKVASKLARHDSAPFSTSLKLSDSPSSNGSTTSRAASADYDCSA